LDHPGDSRTLQGRTRHLGLVGGISRTTIPLRPHDPRIRYCGDFYGQTGEGEPLPGAISADGLIGILTALLPGLMELACHQGSDDELQSTYRSERMQELRVLCDPRVRAALLAVGIELRSFGNAALGGRPR
jgi:hypothetical protein